MKKNLLILLLANIVSQATAQTESRGINTYQTSEATTLVSTPSYSDQYNYKAKSGIYLIPATVLSCSGAMVFAYAGIFMGGATLRDREKYNKLKDDRRKVMILSATLTVASIPLFIIGRRYNQLYKRELAINFHLEPVDDFQGEQLQIASVGFRMRL